MRTVSSPPDYTNGAVEVTAISAGLSFASADLGWTVEGGGDATVHKAAIDPTATLLQYRPGLKINRPWLTIFSSLKNSIFTT